MDGPRPAAPHCPTCGRDDTFVVTTRYGWRATCCSHRWTWILGDHGWTQEAR